MNKETYGIYYDEEGDYLEVSFGAPPETEYTEDLSPGIFITKDEKTNEIKSIGILDFKKRKEILRETLKKLNISMPLEVSFVKQTWYLFVVINWIIIFGILVMVALLWLEWFELIKAMLTLEK